MKLRKVVIAAIGIAVGIAVASQNEKLKIVFMLAMALLLCAGLFFGAKQKGVAIVLCVCIALGFASFSVTMRVFHSNDANQKQVQVVGTLTDEEFVLRDCTVDGKKVSGYIDFKNASYPGKNNKDLTAGTRVQFDCILQDCFPDKDGIYTVDYKSGCRYFTTEILSKVSVIEKGSPNLDESARLYAKDMLSHYLDEQSFGVTYAMIVGDTRYIQAETLQAFRDVGIAHVFAVSGLHVGFVVMLANAFVKKRKKLALGVTMVVVFAYAWVCGFAPSIMRAMIMTFLLLLAKALGREPDFLASLSTAVCFILLLKPLYLFDVGFQMSVGAVLGIDFVTKSIERMSKNKNKIVKKLLSVFGVSFGATLGTLPFMLQYFGSVSLIGVVANVVIIPVVSIVFMATLICLVLPFLFWTFPVIGQVLSAIVSATFLFQNVPVVLAGGFNFGTIAYFLFLGTFSGHCMYNVKQKSVFACFMALVVCLCSVLATLPYTGTKIEFKQSEGDTFCVMAGGQNYIFSKLNSNYDYNCVLSFAQDDTILFVTDFDEMTSHFAVSLAKHTNLTIYSLSDMDYFDDDYVNLCQNGLKPKRIKSFEDEKVKIFAFDYLGKTLATVVEFDGFSFAYADELTQFQTQYLLDNMQKCHAYYSTNAFENIKDKYADSIVVTKNFVDREDIYTTYCCGNFTISPRGGKMVFAK